MSRLKELRLHGFKTFADSTRFVFEPGVNAVIGPNGSGKSNMADAVRWVLGEQSNRSLRTRRADDVIFGGSEHRRPQGLAEAVLTLDNADGWLPVEFAEVTIGRRAYRSGESEYLLNGARVRLRDISELLGEGRLGASELVVVGQGTVDAALSLRPEDRRQLFEEAAGVKALQVRKNEALARLGKARDNLTRVSDLIAELQPQVRRLALQAQHAQEHDALGQRARRLVAEWHRRRERGERDALGDARRAAAAAESELEALRAAMMAGREAIAAAESRYWEAEAAARACAEAREVTREALIRAESRLEALVARLEEQGRASAALERELAEMREAAAASDEVVDPQLSRRQERAAAAEARWQAAVAALVTADEELLRAEDALAETRRRESAQIAAEARRSEQLAWAAARRERISTDLATADASLEAARRSLGPARDAEARARSAVEEALRDREAGEAELREAEPGAVAARSEASSLAERVGALRAELDALRERAEHGSRLGSLLVAAGWPSLLDAIDAPEEAWPAIEAVVGGELGQALVWHDEEVADRLSDARGAARLLAPAENPPEDGRRAALESVAAERTLADWIGTDRAPLLFHRAVVARDLRTLLRGWRSLPPGWCAVTPAGDMADGRGLITLRGRGDPPGGETARQHARRRELAESVSSLEQQEEAARVAAARALARVGELGRQRAAAGRRLEAAEGAARQARREVELAEAQLEDATRAQQELSAELDRLDRIEREATVATAAAGPQSERGTLELGAREARRERERCAAEREAARAEWQTARQAAEEAEARHMGRHQRGAAAEARAAQLASLLESNHGQAARLDAERQEAEAALEATRREDAAAAEKRTAADVERERRRGELLEIERNTGSSASRLSELERAAQAAAIEASRHEEALAALGRERALALESLPEMAAPDEAPTSETDDTGELDDGTLEQELRRVRRTLGQLGSVNPFAVEEHRELAERLDGLASQDHDLGAAIASTEELIVRLETEITERFNIAFAAIGERFDEFVKLLFAGGSASLQLGAGGDGEAPGGIEIVVRPPGKRLQRLAMLSGGERALTGVALLFAMLSVNPVPFCILDEVDAALDEANIGRFATALRRLAETIDFVVITHNRTTIEIADTIYGVTMTDAAVSRVLSLRLSDVPVGASA
jgi:chromosome segregation protein